MAKQRLPSQLVIYIKYILPSRLMQFIGVINFQKQNNLLMDGIIGLNTWNILSPYIYGFKKYRIKKIYIPFKM